METVAKEFLRPAANLIDWTIILKNLLDTAAIAKPVEGGAPEVLAV
jgi:hypothetical protein